MKKIVFALLLILTITIPVVAAIEPAYSGSVTITVNAPIDFKDTINVNMLTTDFNGVVEDEARSLSEIFEIGAETGYNMTFDNLKGGKWLVMLSWKDSKSARTWTIEKFAYEFEVKDGENIWEVDITRTPEKARIPEKEPFYMIFWTLIASTWINSGPVIICLVLVCIWYVWYKYKNFDKYDKK